MTMIELFAGVGAPAMALRNLSIEFETIGISEIESNAIKAYNLIHGQTQNFGDIKKIDKLPYCDFLWASSPCTSFSQNGKKDGLKGESGLLLEVIRLLKVAKENNTLPKIFGFENVADMKTKFPEVYQDFVDFLTNLGYNVYSEILNAAYFGNPQKRERLFIIAIKKEIDNGKFKMPTNETKTTRRLGDLLIPFEEISGEFIHEQKRFENRKIRIRPIPTNTFKTIEDGWYYTDTSTARCQSNRIYNRLGLCPTVTTVPSINILEENCVRRLTPKEHWRAMGFKDEDFEKVKDFKKGPLIKLAGNSICIGPLEAIFKNLFIDSKIEI